MDTLVLFPILMEMPPVFHHWEWHLLWVCLIWPLLWWGRFFLCTLSGEFLSLMCVELWQNIFSSSIKIILRFLFFSLLMCCITLIDLHVLRNPRIPGMNSLWSWCMILLMCCWWKVDAEPWKTLGFLASGGEFSLGPVMRLNCSELLGKKVLLKYKRDRESFWHRYQKRIERVLTC